MTSIAQQHTSPAPNGLPPDERSALPHTARVEEGPRCSADVQAALVHRSATAGHSANEARPLAAPPTTAGAAVAGGALALPSQGGGARSAPQQ